MLAPLRLAVAMLESYDPIACDCPAKIAFTLPEEVKSLTISIWDRWANHRRLLLDATGVQPGSHRVTWDFTDDAGAVLPPETYIFRITADDHVEGGMLCLTKSIDAEGLGVLGPPPQPVATAPTSGLRSFSLHRDDDLSEAASLRAMSANVVQTKLVSKSSDPEIAARQYLREMLDNSAFATVTAAPVNRRPCEFQCTTNKRSPLTGLHYARFQQTYQGIPVFGSLVSVELDADNELVSISSELGEPANVNPHASISIARPRDRAWPGRIHE